MRRTKVRMQQAVFEHQMSEGYHSKVMFSYHSEILTVCPYSDWLETGQNQIIGYLTITYKNSQKLTWEPHLWKKEKLLIWL